MGLRRGGMAEFHGPGAPVRKGTALVGRGVVRHHPGDGVQPPLPALDNDLKARMEMSMILITHDFGIVARMCDKVAVMYAGKIVESGTWDDMFLTKEHHPYTEGLFGAIPDIKSRERRLHPIPGVVADLVHPGADLLPALLFRVVKQNALRDLPLDVDGGVQAAHGILEDHRHFRTPDTPHGDVVEPDQLRPVQLHGPGVHAPPFSYLGLGIQPPTPEWGSMLSEAQAYLRIYPNSVIWPGIVIALVSVALALMGNGLSEAMDPQMKE